LHPWSIGECNVYLDVLLYSFHLSNRNAILNQSLAGEIW
jgi:hypothetical protein